MNSLEIIAVEMWAEIYLSASSIKLIRARLRSISLEII